MVASLHSIKYEVFRNLLTEARKGNGLTQVELAKRLGLPQSFVSKYETGERRLDVTEFIEISKVIGINPIKILTDYMNKTDRI